MKYPHKTHENDPLVYEFPSTFTIGSKSTSAPLVNVEQLQGHLALMRAFALLREQVDKIHEHPKAVLSRIPKDNNRRWAWFAGLAVERFTIWCLTIKFNDVRGKPLKDILPPIDVIMVWHAYMLNPGWYTEDTERLPYLSILHEVGKILAESLPELTGILASDVPDTRVENWTLRTQRLFDPLDDAVAQETKTIYCPTCRYLLQTPLVTKKGKGYLQQHFETRCPKPSCVDQPKITRAVLAARKMAEDLVRDDGSTRTYLAGTLHTPHLDVNIDHAKTVKGTILSASNFTRPHGSTDEQWIVFILKKSMYSLETMKWGGLQRKSGWLVSRILSAYVDDRMFSVELSGAVVRQASFVKKIDDIWWTHHFQNQESNIAFQHAIARFHGFLDLMASSPTAFLVPTLDIDLVWHTHQLMASRYITDCKEYMGRFIDHDDKVNPNRLASSFDDTCRAWKNRFGIQYALCGCLMSRETIKDKLSHFLESHVETPAHLVTVERDDIFDATHASDHNAVYPVGGGPTGKALRDYGKRAKEYQRLVHQGKMDAGLALRCTGHGQAFLGPVRAYTQDGPVATGCVAGWQSDYKPPQAAARGGRRAVGATGDSGTGGSNIYAGFIGTGVDGYGGGHTGGSSGGGGCGGGGSSCGGGGGGGY